MCYVICFTPIAEQEDKIEFIDWQMKINGNSVHQKTSLLLKVSK